MFYTCKLLARDYPNGALVVLGLALVILPELHAKAVFYAYYGIHYQNQTPPPLVANVVDLWWAAEHQTAFIAAAITVTAIGAVMAIVGGFRWLWKWTRK